MYPHSLSLERLYAGFGLIEVESSQSYHKTEPEMVDLITNVLGELLEWNTNDCNAPRFELNQSKRKLWIHWDQVRQPMTEIE